MGNIRLYEVDILRLFLIIVLLMDHSFAPFSGIWDPVKGQDDMPFYWYISRFSSSLFLQMFVFISGYVYGMKCRMTSSFNYKSEIKKKFKRLFIPSLFFSLLYFFIFEDTNIPLTDAIYKIICGCGHLWFLPMLFWCFVFAIVMEHVKVEPVVALPVMIILSLLPFAFLPLRLSQSLSFFLFFYIGFLVKRYDVNIVRFSSNLSILFLSIIYIICFLSSTLVSNIVIDESVISLHLSRIVVDNMIRLFYIVFGLLSIYLLSIRIASKCRTQLMQKIKYIAGLCFGIYIYQQFILKYLYYYVYDESFSIYYLPWIGFLLAGLGSALLTYLTLKIPIGRKMIG